MLPLSYQLPAAILLVLGGALTSFAGYRLFRIVLGVYGFIGGAMLASSTMGISNTTGMIGAAIIGGLAGALILVFAYFVGIALLGAGLGAFVAHVGWSYVGAGDPPLAVIVVVTLIGSVSAMVLQRYVIVVATAFGGAWTVIVGGLAMSSDRGAARAAAADVWILYPLAPAPAQRWVPVAWIVLGLIGTGVQLGITGSKKR